jgi:hypothetical protein
MNILIIANILRYVGVGILIAGILIKNQSVIILGLVVLLAGSVIRNIIRVRESKKQIDK